MKKLNLPEYSFKITSEDTRLFIYDTFRKKKVLLTPEEWVRQNILMFLVREKKYPASLISIESGIKVNRLMKRYDALVYNLHGNPVMLIECKAPGVGIHQDTFDQISSYNLSVTAKFLLVSNGIKHYCCRLNKTGNSYDFLEEIPFFHEL
ncbi:MAG: type I restriction enzyme HsdR N-terminal domain-containing protein [Bacteroidales bacterium]|jgi:hypothetical protein|nr:type I restriction enzyme HsdR N-terminal domain-containing protein [Bacteroidales bacterium]